MRRTLLASLGAALALCVWAGNAAADDGSAAGTSPAGPTAPSDTTLDAFALVSQHVPEFGAAAQPAAAPDAAPSAAPAAAPAATPAAAPEAAPDAVPAETEGASQANGAAAGSLGANGNETSQTVDQGQGGGDEAYPSAPAPAVAPDPAKAVPVSGSTQVAGQSAENEQTADSTATATQIHPTNESASIRVLSPGSDGPVTQSNDSFALSGALNGNETTQDLGQSQGGSGSGGKQIAGQSAKNDQSAYADASSEQIKPSNTNISVRILSPGDDGDVSQSNTNVAGALAVNGNDTGQSIDQSQDGSYGGTQVSGQKAYSKQTADSTADAKQVHPENTNISVRILSPGSNGSVSQSNTNVAGSLAANVNSTCQCISQSQAGGPGGGPQIAGQSASSWQHADSDATANQIGPQNQNLAVRVLSPGADGPVSQSNTNVALSGALNLDKTGQAIDQEQGGGSGGATQVAGQKAYNGQDATSSAYADQVKPSNLNVPVRVLSPGGDGSVEQSNTTLAGSLAANGNLTDQWIGQDPHADHGTSLQAAGQLAGNRQSADSVAEATQCCASNVNAPVDVLSHGGGGGSVQQSNDVAALSAALNLNATQQSIWQSSGGGGGTSIQAAGQKADSSQDATSAAEALQVHPTNVNAPAGVLDGGDHCSSKCDDRCSPKCDEPKRDGQQDEPKRDGTPWDGSKDGGSSWDGPKRDGRPWDEPAYGDDPRGEPKRDACVRKDGCTPRQHCPLYDPCARKPERRVDRCTHPEHRKPERCAKRPLRCEPKDPCSGYSAPEPRRGPMPMN